MSAVMSPRLPDAELKRLEERLTKVFRRTPDSVALSTLDEGRFIDVSEGFERMTGYRREEVIGRTSRELGLWIGPTNRADIMRRLRRRGRVEGGEIGFRTRAGEVRDLLYSVETLVLDGRRCTLWVSRDITERKRMEESLRRLSRRLLRLQDEERRRLAGELLEGPAQGLALLAMNLYRLKRTVVARHPPAARLLRDASALTDQCLDQIRAMTNVLHPPLLDEIGLASAIRWYARDFTERSGIRLKVDIAPDLEPLPPALSTALFRILQECLSNVESHSGSPTAAVRLTIAPRTVTLGVRDRGRGLPAAIGADGTGILGMRERAALLGGRLTITSSDRGTEVTAVLPLRDARSSRRGPWRRKRPGAPRRASRAG
ncbi:MAG TPA: PAS domain-containing sensor histidine kinase [Candidatus Polarisedimenticolia bacterium]|nr:PAS domain-containing sensor histidine kinase [Candidatus Polarisedimenticolia bacterium]